MDLFVIALLFFFFSFCLYITTPSPDWTAVCKNSFALGQVLTGWHEHLKGQTENFRSGLDPETYSMLIPLLINSCSLVPYFSSTGNPGMGCQGFLEGIRVGVLANEYFKMV